jgi:exodeoxyribonuclease-3
LCHPTRDDHFSWFDYRSKAFDREPKRGLRIDYILVTPPLAELTLNADIDYALRAMERPSDHAPVWTQFKLALAPSN